MATVVEEALKSPNILGNLADLVSRCYQCAICSGVCPKARVKPGFLPRRIVFRALTNPKALDDGAVWDCLTCGLCLQKCPMKVDIPALVRAARAGLVEMGGGCTVAHDSLKTLYGIMAGKGVKPRRRGLLAQDVKTNENSDTLYFMGCVPYLDILFKEDVNFEGMGIADNTIRLLNAVGIEPAVLDGEKCCGHDQLWRGQVDQFMELGKQNMEILKRYKRIVTSCPECYRTLALDYKEMLGTKLEVVHISELLAKEVGKLKTNGTHRVATFHDSCRLGRHMGVYDAPREVLRALGYELREMTNTREESLCCGVPQFVRCDDENKEIRRRRLKDAVGTGAEVLITPCAKCQIHLKCLQNDKGEELMENKYNIRIVDFATALMEHLGR